MVQHSAIDHTGITGVGGGGLALLETRTASASATLDFATFISSTYDEYMIEGVALTPATDGADLLMRVGTGGGPTYDSGNNYYGTLRHGAGALASTPGTPNGGSSNGIMTQADAPGSAIMLAKVINELDTGYGHASFSLRLCIPQSTAKMKPIYGTATWHNGTEVFMAMFGYLYASTTALTAVRFLMSSGNIASGVIRAYGIAK